MFPTKSVASASFTLGRSRRRVPARRTSAGGRRMTVVPPLVLSAIVALAWATPSPALGQLSYVSDEGGPGRFTLSAGGRSAPLHAGAGEYPGVLRALRDL